MMLLATRGAKSYLKMVPEGFGEAGTFSRVARTEKDGKALHRTLVQLPLGDIFIGTAVGIGLLAVPTMANVHSSVLWTAFLAIGLWPACCAFAWAGYSLRYADGFTWARTLDSAKGRRETAVLSVFAALLAIGVASLIVRLW